MSIGGKGDGSEEGEGLEGEDHAEVEGEGVDGLKGA